MNKHEALVYARQLEVDRFVRKLAWTAGSPDAAGINFWYDWQEDTGAHVVVRATFGAGTNSTVVELMSDPPVVLYRADDYGRIIHTYRHGQWVHRLRELADAEYEASEQRKREAEAARLLAEAAQFEEINF